MRQKIHVLFVDDQRLILNSVKQVVSRDASHWEVDYANSAEEGICILKEKTIDVVVSDMQMPNKDGLFFLNWVRENKPNIIRFFLSGNSDEAKALESIRIAHQFFAKPFSTKQLIDALEQTHSLYKKIQNPELQGLVASIDRLPIPKKVFFEMDRELRNPNATVESVSKLVSTDAALVGKILQITNSAFFGQSQSTSNITQAISSLGFEKLKGLILMVGIASDHKEILNGLISIDLYSEHCLEVANIASALGRIAKLSSDEQETLFTAGILHDVGKLVVLKKYTEIYTERGWREDPYSAKVRAEQLEQLFSDHAALGAALVALWGLPSSIANAIAFYREPHQSEEENLSANIIHVADALSRFLRKCLPNEVFTRGHCNASIISSFYKGDPANLIEELNGLPILEGV